MLGSIQESGIVKGENRKLDPSHWVNLVFLARILFDVSRAAGTADWCPRPYLQSYLSRSPYTGTETDLTSTECISIQETENRVWQAV